MNNRYCKIVMIGKISVEKEIGFISVEDKVEAEPLADVRKLSF